MKPKRLKDYVGIPEFFDTLLSHAAPRNLKEQLFVVDIEATYQRWGEDMFLSASQLSWLLDISEI